MVGQRNYALPIAVLMLFLGALLLVWAVNSFNSEPDGIVIPGATTTGVSNAPQVHMPASIEPPDKTTKLVGTPTGPGPRANAPAQVGPLHDAAARGDLEAFHAQLARGLDVNAPLRGERAERQGMTPLMSAVHSAGPDTVRAIIAAKADVNAMSDDGFTALLVASERGTLANLKLLLEAQANPDLANHAGQTPLMLAARAGSADKVVALLASGASVTPRDQLGNSALAHAAASNADALIMRVLLDAEADASVADLQGVTPLMKAVERGDVDKVVALLNAGAVLDAKDTAGRTALDRAKARTDVSGTKIAGVLEDAGAF
jgi:ankyrin repeat protein